MLNQHEQIEVPQRENQLEEIKKEQMHLSDIIMLSIIIIYLIVLTIFFVALGGSKNFREFIFDLFSDNYNNDPQGLIYIASFEFLLILTGFDIFLIDVLFGYFIRPYKLALSLLFLTKMIAKFLCFACVKYCLKEHIYILFHKNVYFNTFYIAAQRNPIKILAILQLITLPTAFKTYVVGVFSVTTSQYLCVTAISNFIWTAFWVHVGVQAKNVKNFIETGKSADIVPFPLQISILIGGIAALIYLIRLTNTVYKTLQQEFEGSK